MKKVFAILLVLAIVAGFVFADTITATDTHILKVSSTVGEHLPVFQVRFSGFVATVDSYGNVTRTAQDTLTNENKANFSATTNANYQDTYSKANENKVVDTGWDLGDGEEHSSVFTVYLVKDANYSARTRRLYTLTFSDGVFTGVTEKGDDYNGDGKVVPNIVATGVNAFTGITSSTQDTSNDDVVKIQFSGASCPEADTQVASAVYKWKASKSVDMGTYTANVMLTITQN